MNEPVPGSAPRPVSPTRRAAVVTSVISLVVGALEVLASVVIWYLTATDTSDSPWLGLGYVLALFVGVPGGVAATLGALGWMFADRTSGLVLGVLAAVVAVVPFLLAIP
ncbi:hypothetical protein [Nocardioides sp. WS12]|uniref:hypothetical protein n=1 Tax=Nocardioides sp. WS12 TaxID=2486272 RepID=UPI0015F7D926|nr:hypothetical protein [Nocardioides sp. WS12]